MPDPSNQASQLETQRARYEFITRTSERVDEPAISGDDYLSFHRLVTQAADHPGYLGLHFWPELVRCGSTVQDEDDYQRAIYIGTRLYYRQHPPTYRNFNQYMEIERLWRTCRLDLVVCAGDFGPVVPLQTGNLVIDLSSDGMPLEDQVRHAWDQIHLNHPPRVNY